MCRYRPPAATIAPGAGIAGARNIPDEPTLSHSKLAARAAAEYRRFTAARASRRSAPVVLGFP
jgi:hypothetical protein